MHAFPEIKHAAGGKLRGPENLYENITKSTIATIDNSFPASKGEVRTLVRASDSTLQNELTENNNQFKDYKNETTALIDVVNSLVREVNALTPVGS